MRKLLPVVFLTLFSSAAFAADNGFYIGVDVGQVKTNYGNATNNFGIKFDTVGNSGNLQDLGPGAPSVNSSGLGGNIYFGYQYNHYLATEAGYTYMPSVNLLNKETASVGSVTATGDLTLDEQAGDLVEKFMLPIASSGITLFAKGGIAYITAREKANLTVTGIGPTPIQFSDADTVNAFRPTYGAGISYDFTNSFTGNISWQRIQGNNNIQNVNLAAVGVAYHFGN